MINASDSVDGRYMHIHFPYISIKYMAYMCSLVVIFISCIYIAVACKVDIVYFVLSHICLIVRSVFKFRMRQCDLYLQCNSHICWMIYACNMKCSLGSLCTLFLVIWLMLMTSYVAHACLIYLWNMAYVQYGWHILSDIYCSDVWRICYIWFNIGTYMHQCWIYMPIWNEGSVNLQCSSYIF